MGKFGYSSAASVDKGLIRSNNEDNFYINGTYLTADNRDNSKTFTATASDECQVYGVFDGMGGEELGEEASLIAAQTVGKAHKRILSSDLNAEQEILGALEDANARICRKIRESSVKRIGATFASVIITDDEATVINVGDSRVYLLHEGTLSQISLDDTTAQRLLRKGIITAEEAKTHSDRHKLTQHLGIFRDEMTLSPHVSQPIALEKNDKILLCSDGLTDMLDDEEICSILSRNKSSEEVSRDLLSAALKHGGMDNVTVLVIGVGAPFAAKKKKTGLIFALSAVLLAVVIAVIAVTAGKRSAPKSAPEPIAATNIFFATQVTGIPLGTESIFNIGVIPADAEGNAVFSSSDENVIFVDSQTGKYRATGVGQATVTAVNGTAVCQMTVTVYSAPESIAVSPEEIRLKPGEKQQLTYTFEPAGAAAAVTFSVDDGTVAEVSEDGIVTAQNAGAAEITVSAGTCSDTVKVTVADESKKKDDDKKEDNPKTQDDPKTQVDPEAQNETQTGSADQTTVVQNGEDESETDTETTLL